MKISRALSLVALITLVQFFSACPRVRRAAGAASAKTRETTPITCWVMDDRTGVATHGPCP